MEWSQEQQLAINNDDKNILVSAAAGSGKTAVLVERVVSHLLRDPETEPHAWDVDRLLVVTFTNAAAEEMKQRIKKRLQEVIVQELDQPEVNRKKVRRLERQQILLSGASICTIDSFCQNLVRNNFNAIDIDPKFRIANGNELVILQQDVLDELFEQKYADGDEALTGFAAKYGTDRGDSVLYDILLNLYVKAQNQPFPDLWLDQLAADYKPAGQEITCLEKTKWWPIIKREISCHIVPVQAYLEQLVSVAGQIDEPKVKEVLDKVVYAYDEGIKAIKAGLAQGWHEVYAAVSNMKIPALRFSKKLSMEEEKEVEFVKDNFTPVRDKLKKYLDNHIGKLVQVDADVLLEDLKGAAEDVACIVQMVKDFSAAYAQAKREKNIVDFSDVEHFALHILNDSEANPGEIKPSEIALALRERYQEIMVDEYQDTNEVQDFLVRLIAGEANANTFTVGDVKQSIYRFRSSEPGLFLGKYKAYEQPDNEQGELITLGRNFRSRREVLSAINYVFAQVMTPVPNEIDYDERAMLNEGEPYGYQKPVKGDILEQNVELAIINSMSGEDMEDPQAEENVSDNEDDGEDEELRGLELEAQYIADRLKEIKQSGRMVFDKNWADNKGYRPVTWRDMVILLRATRDKAVVFQEILQKNGIPVYANADDGFFKTTEIQLMYSILSVIDNAQQDIYLAAVLYSPVVGLSTEDLAQLRLAARNGDLYTALLAANTPDSGVSADIKDKVDKFLNLLSSWRQLARQVSVPELIWQIFRDTGYYDYAGSLPGGMLRQANLRMLVTRAQEFQSTDYQGLFRFLRFIQRMRDMETDLSMARTLGEGEDVVRVMTIHKSKGLEFPVVVIADMWKEFNEKELTKDVLVHKELGLGLSYVDPELMVKYPTFAKMAVKAQMKRDIRAEELRVLYVAMTRAREKLIMVGRISKNHRLGPEGERWCEYVGENNKVLPEHSLLAVNSFMDWVATAVVHHQDGAPIVKYVNRVRKLDIEQVNIPGAMGGESNWAVSIVEAGDIRKKQQNDTEDNALLKAVQAGELITGVKETAALSDHLELNYDYRGTREVPAKLSVSELKRQFAKDLQTEDMQQLDQEHREYIFNRPRFIQEDTGKAGLRGNEYGTLMHSVMQHLELAGPLDRTGIKQQLDKMVANELMTPEQASYIKISSITSFLASELGQRLINADELWRELPFSRELAASAYYKDVDEEYIFSQGVIDVLFKEKDGSYVLLDYKTDTDTQPEAVKNKYALQIQLYTDAIEQILGVKVAGRYLVMLHDSSVVEM